jgi:hypothetical protein
MVCLLLGKKRNGISFHLGRAVREHWRCSSFPGDPSVNIKSELFGEFLIQFTVSRRTSYKHKPFYEAPSETSPENGRRVVDTSVVGATPL